MKTVIFDIDGTLADSKHRQYLLDSTPKDWDKFHTESVKDKPIEQLKRIHQCISDSNISIVYVTARPQKYREITEKWLQDNIQHYSLDMFHSVGPLYMRKNNDFRKAEVVKKQILDKLRSEGREVFMAFDDNKAVIDMFRENGVMAFHHTDDEFKPDTKVKALKTPKLIVMIGGAGSGKTSFLENYYVDNRFIFYHEYYDVISTDNIRELTIGDFEDQSNNNNVFEYAVERLKLNNKYGISSVIDATNLKWKYRKRWIECMPEESEITYVIVDRPLKDKIKTGGWRNNVVMKNCRTLIEYHDDVFRLNYEDILNGDGLPNVTPVLIGTYAIGVNKLKD